MNQFFSLQTIVFAVFVCAINSGCSNDLFAQLEVEKTGKWGINESSYLDLTSFKKLDQQIKAGGHGPVDHLLLIHQGELVFERSYPRDYHKILDLGGEPEGQYNYDDPAWHPYYKDSKLHSLQSVTKSITALAIGIAIDRGSLQSVDEKIIEIFDDTKIDHVDERKRQLTLKNLLTMRSGIEWNESLPYSDPRNSCILLEKSGDWFQFVIQKRLDHDPGNTFEYNSGASLLLSAIIKKKTGKHVDEYLNEHLFKPMGIKSFYWKKTPKGLCDTEGGLYLSAGDLAKIGQLCLHQGKWNGKQLISKEWMHEMLHAHVADVAPTNSRNNQGYGYQWWLMPNPSDKDNRFYTCLGFGGQYLIVDPKARMVAVANGWSTFGQRGLAPVLVRNAMIDAVKRKK